MNGTKQTYTFSQQMIGVIKLMRPKQWIKNSFVLAPLLFTGEFLIPISGNRLDSPSAIIALGKTAKINRCEPLRGMHYGA